MIYLFSIVLVVLQCMLPWRWAFVPLLLAALHAGNVELVKEMTPCRILILVGLARAVGAKRFVYSSRCPLDLAVVFFSVFAILIAAVPRLDVPSPLRQNLGLIYNVAGTYFYGRAYLPDSGAIWRFATAMSFSIMVLAAGLTIEQQTRKNPYSFLGSIRGDAVIRNGRIRALGPFKHPILTGTAGAAAVPIACILWRRRRRAALIGIISGIAGTVASSSSGPLAALLVSVVALAGWRFRGHLRFIQRMTLALLIVMHLTSSRGVWYLMARMDLVGGSTGYHRARLIDSAIEDLAKWWLAGTDYTRNWMWSGVSWSTRHTDITNYFLHIGVIGGIGLLGGLLAMLWFAFRTIGRAFSFSAREEELEETSQKLQFVEEDEEGEDARSEIDFAYWCVGSAILAHAVTFLSVSYFDQMYVVFYLTLGLVPSFLEKGEEEEDVEPSRELAMSPMR